MAQVALPPGVELQFLLLGVPADDVPDTIRAMASKGDPRAKHLDCGYLGGCLGHLMCREGHTFEQGGPEFSGADILGLWRAVTGRAEEG